MGLSVCVYKNILPTKIEDDIDFYAYVIDDGWKHKIKNLTDGMSYRGDRAGFSIGYSYSTHNRFREYLVDLIGWGHLINKEGRIKWGELSDDVPFIDFIDFADNEGCLDWETSKKIFQDFEKFKHVAEASKNYYMKEKYFEWYNVFEDAKDKGVVVFS